jgi:LuxR family maltose regulon positive regulatory protein
MRGGLAPYSAVPENGLLTAKIHLPEPRQEWIERTEPIDRLVSGHDRRLVLITAPAGYGKSTLISQWRADIREPRTFAYVSLDHRDNDPVALWTAIMVAISRACPELDTSDLVTGLRAAQIDTSLLPALLDRLARLGRPLIVLLDDFHAISEPACHQQIGLFLRHLPPSCQLVTATRGTPPLGLARLRASADLLEVRTGDLRFSVAEIGTLVRHITGSALTDAALVELADRTEGWPAGVYLAALSMGMHDNPGGLVEDLTVSNQYILDYLSEEVLSGLPEQTRRFLIRTCVLERFTAPLCEVVAGTTNAAQVLEELERANLFLIPLDNDRQWFRYHHLLASALRAQLAREEPGVEAPLHELACAWLEQTGMIEDAIEHAFAAGAPERLIDLIGGHWPEFASAGRHATVQGWLALLGDDTISRAPVAAICAAWQAAFAGDRHAVTRWLATAESLEHAGPLPDGTASVTSAAALIRATFGLDGLEQMLRSARIAAELETDPSSTWYGLARLALGYSLHLTGRTHEAIEPLEQAAQSQSAIPIIRILVLSVLSLVTGRLGRSAAAGDLADTARELVQAHYLTESPQASLAFTAAGVTYARSGRLEAARKELEHSLRIRRPVRGLSPWPTLDSLVALADLALAQSDRADARGLYEEAADLLAAMPDEDSQVKTDLESIHQQLAEAGATPSHGLPLTKREQTVLRLLQSRLSLAEIAGELFLSANTVKTHTRAIYQKLEVSTRDDAIQRARQLRLL